RLFPHTTFWGLLVGHHILCLWLRRRLNLFRGRVNFLLIHLQARPLVDFLVGTWSALLVPVDVRVFTRLVGPIVLCYCVWVGLHFIQPSSLGGRNLRRGIRNSLSGFGLLDCFLGRHPGAEQ